MAAPRNNPHIVGGLYNINGDDVESSDRPLGCSDEDGGGEEYVSESEVGWLWLLIVRMTGYSKSRDAICVWKDGSERWAYQTA
jgi:hypothetical protein